MVEIEEEPGTQFEMKDSEIMPILSKPPFAKPDDYEDGVDQDNCGDKKNGDKTKDTTVLRQTKQWKSSRLQLIRGFAYGSQTMQATRTGTTIKCQRKNPRKR